MLPETPRPLRLRKMASPVGELTLLAGDDGLAAVLWQDERPGRVVAGPAEPGGHPMLDAAQDQLNAYFEGRLRRFDLPLDFRGTDFQRAVWRALLDIPYGETRSYGEIARALGRPGASRAVGAANGRNPISIVAPCHRVIGSGGGLTGFAGGLAAKTWLLRLEGHPLLPL
ncbi:methylated-DNA--[protein]-cysteine S-methyltransferase [Novosphingobium sp. FGD1]|jgi:methylated-DNA-[protein]-cysteine S-methyltransferase|uniref:Methylated-DNA--protein-cysteine methyltransferase n=1 Tax=Novosphingobium silvae TaxID=2692619 RepID=A0A7X4K6U6_9SPHN|nr:methylated-DNA--[protein]-cysteine S-methyltransferase [Novosphingobium silvae]MYL97495.1 methylated-DNA--[protein]-cysteine S-methyltransferase [Novosphingobium silvae]